MKLSRNKSVKKRTVSADGLSPIVTFSEPIKTKRRVRNDTISQTMKNKEKPREVLLLI